MYIRGPDSMENALEPLGRGADLIHMRSCAMLNVQHSCSGETDAHVDQVSEVWELAGDAYGSVRWILLDRSHDDRPHCSRRIVCV